MKSESRKRRPAAKLVLALGLLSLAYSLPSRAIDSCHLPCLRALDRCLAPCFQPPFGPTCGPPCEDAYEACLQNTVCP